MCGVATHFPQNVEKFPLSAEELSKFIAPIDRGAIRLATACAAGLTADFWNRLDDLRQTRQRLCQDWSWAGEPVFAQAR